MREWRAHLRWIVLVMRETVTEFLADKGPMMGAAIAFHAVLALAPLLVLLVSVAGFAFGEASARARMEVWIFRTFEGPAAHLAVQILDNATTPGTITLPGLFSTALAIYYTARLFHALQLALNHIWNIEQVPGEGVRGVVRSVVRKRILSFALMLTLGLLILLSLGIETALPALAGTFRELPGAWYLYRALVAIGSTLAVGVIVALVYRILPDVRVRSSYTWGGAMLTAGLLVIGKFLLGLYLATMSVMTVPGAAGSVFALLLWTYFSAQVFLFGAELTQVVARHRGHGFGTPPAIRGATPAASDNVESTEPSKPARP